MKILRKLVMYSLCMVVGLPCFSIASRKDSACNNVTENRTCEMVSENYKQPYCITNFSSNRSDEDVDNVDNCVWSINTNKFSGIISKDTSTSDLIALYCNSLFGSSNNGRIYFAKPNVTDDSWDWQQTFDSHQSLFVNALCSSFEDKEGNMPFIDSNDLLLDVYKGDLVKILNLQQFSDGKNLCSISDEPSLNRCDLGIYITKIFAGIVSDVYKIKYAQVLNVDTSEKVDMKRKVESFMNGYFAIDSSYEKLKEDYSKTISKIESNQKFYKNVLDSVKIIDNNKLAKLAENSNCSPGGYVVGTNFIACALHSSQGNGSPLTPSFLTLVYNELLHYRHFMSYYTYAMQVKARNTNDLEAESKILDFQRYADMQMEAFQSVQHDFEEFSMTYPLHIWVSLYTEKVAKFRKKFVKVISLFYSLSEKLQNVQLPS